MKGEGQVLLIGDNKVSEVICLNCHTRWAAARPVDVRLDDLECPTCGCIGLAIETGETAIAEDLLRMAGDGKENE